MMRLMLRSKIHRARVTRVSLDYEGSIAIDRALIRKAGLLPGEKVLVANLRNGRRFETYVIEGTRGEIGLNGAAACLGKRGDLVIIMGFAVMSEREARANRPRVVHVDAGNKPFKEKSYAQL